MSKPITSRMHGMLDYPAAIVLILSPWIFGFHDVGGAAVALPIIVGVLSLLQSPLTDYELGVVDMIPLRMHLMLDVVAGFVLAISPWLFGFADEGTNAWLPHLLLGLLVMGSGLMTRGDRETEAYPIGNPSHGGRR
jgi:predicted membrane metal-binding protein